MKKSLICFVIFMICTLSAAGVMAAGNDRFDADFENYDIGSVCLEDFDVSVKTGHYIETDGTNKYLRVAHSDENRASTVNLISKYNLSLEKETVFTFDIHNRNSATGRVVVQLRSHDGKDPDSTENLINLVYVENNKITYLPEMVNKREDIEDTQTARIVVVLNPVSGSLVLYDNEVEKANIESIYSYRSSGSSWKDFDFTKTVFRIGNYVKATPADEVKPYVTDIVLDNIRVAEGTNDVAVSLAKTYFNGVSSTVNELKDGPLCAKATLINKSSENKNVYLFLTHKSGGTLYNMGFCSSELAPGEIKSINCALAVSNALPDDYLELMVLDAEALTPLIAPKLTYLKHVIQTPVKAELEYIYKQRKPSHPRVVAVSDDFERVRRLVETDEVAVAWAKKIVSEADKMVDADISDPNSPYYIAHKMSDVGHMLTMADRTLTMMKTLGMAHKLSGMSESDYSEKASYVLNIVARFADWNPAHFQDTAEMMTAFAIGYDWMYDAFDETTLETIEKAVYEKGLLPADNAYKGIGGTQNSGWWKDVDYNWNTACNGAIVITSTAFADVYPSLCFDLSARAFNNIKKALKPFSPDGAYVEGYTYGVYSLRFLSKVETTFKNTYGTDFGMMKNSGLNGAGDYLIHIDGSFGVNNYHDTNDYHTVFGKEHHIDTATLLWLGNIYENPKYSAARLRNIENYGYKATPFDLLWYNPSLTSDDFKDIPTDAYFRGTELVSMRSGFGREDIFLSAHGGIADFSHSHIDGGSFVLDMLGTRFANDIGADFYDKDGYFGDRRFEYYRTRAEGHNTIVINPDETPGQSTDCNLKFERHNFSGNNPFAILDMTPAYKDYGALSVKRGYMLCDNRQSAVIRDEMELSGENTVYWFMQTTADEITVSDNILTLTKDGKTIKAEFVTDSSDFTLSYGKAEPLPESNSTVENIASGSYKRISFKTAAKDALTITVKFTPISGEFSDINTVTELSQWK